MIWRCTGTSVSIGAHIGLSFPRKGLMKKVPPGGVRHFERNEKSAFEQESRTLKSRFLVVSPRNDGSSTSPKAGIQADSSHQL